MQQRTWQGWLRIWLTLTCNHLHQVKEKQAHTSVLLLHQLLENLEGGRFLIQSLLQVSGNPCVFSRSDWQSLKCLKPLWYIKDLEWLGTQASAVVSKIGEAVMHTEYFYSVCIQPLHTPSTQTRNRKPRSLSQNCTNVTQHSVQTHRHTISIQNRSLLLHIKKSCSGRKSVLWSCKIKLILWIQLHEPLLFFSTWYWLSGSVLPSWFTLVQKQLCCVYFWRCSFLSVKTSLSGRAFEVDYTVFTAIIEFWQMFKAARLHIKALSFFRQRAKTFLNKVREMMAIFD